MNAKLHGAISLSLAGRVEVPPALQFYFSSSHTTGVCAIFMWRYHRSLKDMTAEKKLDLLQGTLDLLVLQVLSSRGSMHGYGIARRIEQISGDQVLLNQGTIYASLVRLQHRRLIKASWGTSDNNRRAKYYTLTKTGERELREE